MENNYIQKAKTIASFVKKNKHLFKESSNELAQFLYQELSKRKKYANYIYRLDNVEIQFFINPTNGDGRDGGYLWCNVKNINTDNIGIVFKSYEDSIKYCYLSACFDIGINEEFLFDWDKIIEGIEECIDDVDGVC